MYAKRIASHERKLCAEETKVDIWQTVAQGPFSERRVCSQHELLDYVESARSGPLNSPRCRFVFLHGKNARSRLYVSGDILKRLLAFHQVMPAFVEPLLSFGQRQNETVYAGAGFRQEITARPISGTDVLGRSGKRFELYYSLRTVELKTDGGWPWVIRQTSTYHSFDLVNGQSFWLILKGNTAMRDRIHSATMPNTSASDYTTFASSLASTLSMHLVMCRWSTENWRKCIEQLEQEVEELTWKALTLEAAPPRLPERRSTFTTSDRAVSKDSSIEPSLIRRSTSRLSQIFHSVSRKTTSKSGTEINLDAMPEVDEEGNSSDEALELAEETWSIHDLQKIQTTEDRLGHCLLVLRTNCDVLKRLRAFYDELCSLAGMQQNRQAVEPAISHFGGQLIDIEHDFSLQQMHLETLMRSLTERKTLVSICLVL